MKSSLLDDFHDRPTVIFFAFKGLDEINIISNLASIEHDAEESENLALSKINYDW